MNLRILATYTLLPLPLVGMVGLFLHGNLSLAPRVPISLLLSVFPYLIAACIGFYLLYFLVRRTKFAAIMLVLAGILLLVRYAESLVPADNAASPRGDSIKVMTWNVQRLGLFDNQAHVQANLARVCATIRQEQPDLLILQEISHHQMQALRAEMNIAPGACDWTDYHGRGRPRFGGLAVCVVNEDQWTILTRRSLDLPPSWKYLFVEFQNSRKQTINLLGLHVVPPKMTEERLKNILWKALRFDSSAVGDLRDVFIDYKAQIHLQEDQIRLVIDQVNKFKDPTIIAGDFNSPPDLPLHYKLRGHLNDAWLAAGSGMGHTRVWGGFLALRIDYIYVSEGFVVTGSKTLNAEFSDHKPLIATMHFGSGR